MAFLVDTSVLGRLASTGDAQHSRAIHAVLTLEQRGEILLVAPQSLIEFRNFSTRPKKYNGLGLTPAEAEAHIADFKADFQLIPESPDVFPAWEAIAHATGVIGKQVHDARLVAICQVAGVASILTFNVTHFTMLATFVPGLAIVDPMTV
jgi:predicted nucleic acid-binding protein